MTDRQAVEIVILSGFLGSGKTTLLGEFLGGRQLLDTAVIVNEVGEIGIDAAVLNESIDGDDVLMLDNGCVCCSLRSSLVDTILRLLRMPRPVGAPPLTRIVVETSGLSKPGPIVASLRDRDLVRANLKFMVISTFDCSRVDDSAYYASEALAQWAASHRVVLTKLDSVTDDATNMHIAVRVAAISPLAQIISGLDRCDVVRRAFAPLQETTHLWFDSIDIEAEPSTLQATAHADVLVLKAETETPVDWDEFAAWVDDLAGLCGERLLRLKALLWVKGVSQQVLLQSVGTTFSAPVQLKQSKASMTKSVLIVIVRQMTIEEFQRHLPDSPTGLSLFAVPSRRTRRVFDVPIVQ